MAAGHLNEILSMHNPYHYGFTYGRIKSFGYLKK